MAKLLRLIHENGSEVIDIPISDGENASEVAGNLRHHGIVWTENNTRGVPWEKIDNIIVVEKTLSTK